MSTQNTCPSVHTEPLAVMTASTGTAAASANQGHVVAATRPGVFTRPAAATPIANSTANWGARLSKEDRYGPASTTTTVTAATMTTALRRRTMSSSNGNTRYNWASTAIVHIARLGVEAGIRSCSSRACTTTERASGAGWPGCGRTSHATSTLSTSAAQ